MPKRMTKMEACHHLFEIRKQIANESQHYREMAQQPAPDDPETGERKRFRERMIAENEEKMQALDMAGAALTR